MSRFVREGKVVIIFVPHPDRGAIDVVYHSEETFSPFIAKPGLLVRTDMTIDTVDLSTLCELATLESASTEPKYVELLWCELWLMRVRALRDVTIIQQVMEMAEFLVLVLRHEEVEALRVEVRTGRVDALVVDVE